MKLQYLILSVFLIFQFSLKAEEQIHERVYVHTDKDCYIAGENILLKFYVINSAFQPSALSKVGYVEICSMEKPQMQVKVTLEKGSGTGRMQIPEDIPSGIYQLTGYTRYMRNEGENVFFKKQIAIVNVEQQIPDSKRFELVDKYEKIQPVENEQSNLRVKTDQNVYGNRKNVILSINNIPDNTADLVVSVTGNDSIASVPEVNYQDWLKQVKDTLNHFSGQWLPEYEGHIITGRIIPQPRKEERLISDIAFVGKDIRYFNGQIDSTTGNVNYYTAGILGKQQVVTTVVSSPFYGKSQHRVDLLPSFDESLPDSLPVLQIYPNKKQLLERYIGVQIQGKLNGDSLRNFIQSPDYCAFQPTYHYDLDEYTRFGSIAETILEFIYSVHVYKTNGIRELHVYLADEQRFSIKSLVLLDGVPVYDHEDILKYNPLFIKKINIYDGHYAFGGGVFEGIVSFITREGNLPFFQLGDGYQLFNYECPQLPLSNDNQDYSTDQMKNSRKPDFRHTLYWNPSVEYTAGQPVNLSFYTSDLCGEFKVTVEGITTDGKIIHNTAVFKVMK